MRVIGIEIDKNGTTCRVPLLEMPDLHSHQSPFEIEPVQTRVGSAKTVIEPHPLLETVLRH